MKNKRYVLEESNPYIYCTNFVYPNFLYMLRDGHKEFNPDQLTMYFDRGFKIFQERLEHFSKLQREMTPEEEKELKFMLDSLIYAKNSIHFFKGSRKID